MGRKIATCSYCGTRAVLVFDEGLHELTCGACGAPLHDMKMMPQASDKEPKKSSVKRAPQRVYTRREVDEAPRQNWREGPSKKRRKKKRKPIMGRVLEELWDVVEDIFD